MGGFTIYETLRIFVPGAIALAVANLVLRLGTGVQVLQPAPGSPHEIVGGLQSVVLFAVLAVGAGLALYLVDLPSRLRIYQQGDPVGGWPLPSDTFNELVDEADGSSDAAYDSGIRLALFFNVVDQYLPTELHKRVYLFGSLFKIYTDARAISVGALCLGVPVALAQAGSERMPQELRFATTPSVAIAVIVVAIATLGFLGTWRNRGRATEMHDAATALRCSAVVGTLSVLSVAVAVLLPRPWGHLSVVPAIAALASWFAIECGPPARARSGATSGRSLRDSFLSAIGVAYDERPQLPIWLRTCTDLAVCLPALVGASILDVALDRRQSSVLAWGVLAVLAVMVMSVRKHEARLLHTYQHQVAFIEISRNGIVDLLKARRGLPADLSVLRQPIAEAQAPE